MPKLVFLAKLLSEDGILNLTLNVYENAGRQQQLQQVKSKAHVVWYPPTDSAQYWMSSKRVKETS